jgi:hypothetical protein
MTVKQTVDEVQIAGTAASRAYREFAGQMRLSSRRKRCNLLVPDMEPLDLAMPADGVRQTVEAVANNPVDALNPCGGKCLDELVRYGLCHGLPIIVRWEREEWWRQPTAADISHVRAMSACL